MYEIKFRAWDRELDKMTKIDMEDRIIHKDNREVHISIPKISVEGDPFEEKNDKGETQLLIPVNYYDLEHILYWSEKFIPMRSTGCSDEFGTEIFDDDVVKFSNEDVGIICWSDYGLYFTVDILISKYNKVGESDSLSEESFEGCRIVGNVYENPEWLKLYKELQGDDE